MQDKQDINFDDYKYGFSMPQNYTFKAKKGLNKEIVAEISRMKNEPQWMLDFRLKSYEIFLQKPMPTWGGDLSKINFDDIYYYIKPIKTQAETWAELPSEIKETYDRIGIPEAEKKYLSGVSAQYECITGESLVFTNHGATQIKDIQKDTFVYSLNEETKQLERQRVIGLACKGVRPVYLLKVAGREIRCTLSHPLLALQYSKRAGKQKGSFSTQWRYLQDLSPGDYVAIVKNLPDRGEPYHLPKIVSRSQFKGKNQFTTFTATYNLLNHGRNKIIRLPTETSESLMWLIGLYLGDGYISRTSQAHEVLSIAIPVSDQVTRKKIQSVCKEVFNYDVHEQKEKYRIRIQAAPIVAFFKQLGLKGTAYTKAMPEWVFSLPNKQKYAFISGYIDSDGYLRNDTKNSDAQITSVNKPLLQQVQLLAVSCGLHAGGIHQFKYNPDVTDKQRIKTGYRLQLSGNLSILENYSLKVKTGFRARKYYHSYNSHHQSPLTSHTSREIGFAAVQAIEYTGEENVYDIEVEGHHNFVANGVIVHNSEVVYESVNKALNKLGVIFCDMDTALKKYPEIVKEYFGKLIPPHDNKFAALNSATWSGGSFVYIPTGVKVDLPLQAYFRINAEKFGQFERTLIIAEEGSQVHYVEGCTAPVYTTDSLHSAVVEIFCKQGARVRYTTVQNWSKNVYNLVTKRARAEAGAFMEWIDCNLGCLAEGSTVTTPEGMKSIESLNIGEKVLSFDDKLNTLVFRKVLAKRFSGHQSVHTASVGERKLQVTGNHPFYSYVYHPERPKKLGRYMFAYTRADHLKKAFVPCASLDYGKSHKLKLPTYQTEFSSANQYATNLQMIRARTPRLKDVSHTTDNLMWLFGYWIGDGNMELKAGKTQNVIRWSKVGFSTPSNDRAQGKLMLVMGSLIDVDPYIRKDGNNLGWCSKELTELFILNGFTGKARDKRVPYWIWSVPESQRLAFIAGYIDADGTINKNRFLIKSVNRSLLEDIASLLVTLGITSHLNTEFSDERQVKIMGYTSTAHGSHRLSFRADQRFAPFVSPTLQAKMYDMQKNRKLMRPRIGRSQLTMPRDVELDRVNMTKKSARAVPTWDIEVEGTGNFVSQGFIVHNSQLTMKYPSVYLMGEGARGEVLSIAFAGDGQVQDAGAKMIHFAPNTSSRIVSKSISKAGGRTSYRGLIQVRPGAKNARVYVSCDALILDEESRSDTYPYMKIKESDVTIQHEATVEKLGEEKLFYLMSRGLDKAAAEGLLVNGFIDPVAREIPLEYSIELNRLINLEMAGSVG